MIPWLVFALLALVVIGKFADFLIGSKGQREVKSRLADWYLQTAEQGWSRIVCSSAASLDDFLSQVFGRRIASLRGAGVMVLVTFGLTTSLILAALPFDLGFWSFVARDRQARVLNSLNVVTLLLTTAVIALPCLVVTRFLLRLARKSSSHALIGSTVVIETAVGYVAVAASISLAFPVMLANAGALVLNAFRGWTEHLSAVGLMIKHYTPQVFLNPWGQGALMSFGRTNLAVFAASASLPAFLYLAIIGTSWAIKLTEPVTKRPLLLLVDRLEASPNGIFTMIAGAAALVAALATAFVEAVA